jgi:hypothetical protein
MAKWVLDDDHKMLDPNIEDDGFITIVPDTKLIMLKHLRDQAYIEFLNAVGPQFLGSQAKLEQAERDLRNYQGKQMTTEVIEAVVDEITFSTNSAFATSVATGDVIFINARIVNAVGIDRGQRRKFIVLPNYPDKQAQVMWRAMRVEPTFDYNNPSIVPEPVPPKICPRKAITKFDEVSRNLAKISENF